MPNKVTLEVKAWAQSVLEDVTVRNKTLAMARAGRLAPAVFNELLHYAYGKPKDTTVLENPDGTAVQFYVPTNGRDSHA